MQPFQQRLDCSLHAVHDEAKSHAEYESMKCTTCLPMAAQLPMQATARGLKHVTYRLQRDHGKHRTGQIVEIGPAICR